MGKQALCIGRDSGAVLAQSTMHSTAIFSEFGKQMELKTEDIGLALFGKGWRAASDGRDAAPTTRNNDAGPARNVLKLARKGRRPLLIAS